VRQNEERRPRRHPNPLQAAPDRHEVESERMTAYMEQRKRDFRQKREEHRNNTLRGFNIPQMSQIEMRKVREGLVELFKAMINPMMKEFQLRAENWDNWVAFERAYEEVMHLLRLHIIKALKRNPETVSGQRRINPLIQKARVEQSEKFFMEQEMQKAGEGEIDAGATR
jgi:hypothetical protein